MTNIDATTPQLKTVKRLFDAYCTLDMQNVLPLLAKDYTFQTFPKIPGLPDETKGAHLEKYGGILGMFTKLETIVHEVIEAPGKVITHITFICTTVDDTTLEYDSVIINTLVEEDGELKILENKDFSDPEKRGNLHSWATKALAKGASAV